jgi:transcriptional regulator with XRE-family HTH domain
LPHAVDLVVGKRLRIRRSELSLSQTELAKRLGLTFQQVQKYEAGTNRVSCSRLAQLCQVLEVPVTYFFSFGSDEEGSFERLDLSMIKDGHRLVSAFQRLPNAETRRLAIGLIENIASSLEDATTAKAS